MAKEALAEKRQIPAKEMVGTAEGLAGDLRKTLFSNDGFKEALFKHAFDLQGTYRFTRVDHTTRFVHDYPNGEREQLDTQIGFRSKGRIYFLQYAKSEFSTSWNLKRRPAEGKDFNQELHVNYSYSTVREPYSGIVHFKSGEEDVINTDTAVEKAKTFIADI